MNVAAVVFDLWETLVPLPGPLRRRAFDAMAAALDADPDALAEAWKATRTERETGRLEPVARSICRELGLAVTGKRLAGALAARTSVHREAFSHVRPDAMPTLEALRELGLRIGLVSNCTSDLPPSLEASPLAPLLDAAVFSCSEGAMKPDPVLYRRAAERLGVPPERCVYVGDGSDDELAGARAVGMTPVLLAVGEARGWDGLRIRALRELPPLVEGLPG